MQYLLEQLETYQKSDVYPFHMPGHKRKPISFANPYTIDITEIDGFDNLHHADGILKEAQMRAAELYGAEKTYYLVNGSTCGLLAAICAVTHKRDKVLVARNCHKAVYHAMFLNELQAQYMYPAITATGIQGQITAEQVEKEIYENPDIEAIILTSPTYEGIVSDIEGIAKIVHKHGIPLIVDAAHGAHFGFGEAFPESPVKLGADVVIMSLHKTLPSFTQTAVLHVCSDLVSKEQVERYLGIFETSSPSYLFMAGMDECIRMVKENGAELFKNYRSLLNEFYHQVSDLKYLHVMNRNDLSKEEAYDWDDSKLVIFSEKAGLTGEELHQKLFKQYHLQMEMVSGAYVLGMTSIMDEKEGLERLSKALHEIDLQAAEVRKVPSDFIQKMYVKNECEMQIYQAAALPEKEVGFSEAVGMMASGYIFLYPPGIPLIVPGEIITEHFLEKIEECIAMKLRVEGAIDTDKKRIKIVYF